MFTVITSHGYNEQFMLVQESSLKPSLTVNIILLNYFVVKLFFYIIFSYIKNTRVQSKTIQISILKGSFVRILFLNTCNVKNQ